VKFYPEGMWKVSWRSRE